MPIKQVVCSICKETVNKAVTYHVGGTDRACGKHEGVAEKKAKLDVEKQKVQAMSVQKAEHRRPEGDGFGGHGEWSGDFMTPKCWVCMNKGLRAQEFFLKYLVECEKQSKITGKPVIPFIDGAVKMDTRCIFVLTKEKCEAAMKYVREDFRAIIDMGGIVAICADCCHLNKIEAMPKLTLDQLRDGMVLGELVVRPAVEAQAIRELARDN